ncbi:MAG: hypothetical protein ACTS6G_05475 [Candidatus Hodgkinia cicadicola]
MKLTANGSVDQLSRRTPTKSRTTSVKPSVKRSALAWFKRPLRR